jgi:flagellar FliL protein
MAAKTEAPPAAAPAGDAEALDKKSPGMLSKLVPIIAVIVLAPVASWAVAKYVIIPQLKHELASLSPTDAVLSRTPALLRPRMAKLRRNPVGMAKTGRRSWVEGNSYTFENVVVNLAGTMGTRYLKATFMVSGSDAGTSIPV